MQSTALKFHSVGRHSRARLQSPRQQATSLTLAAMSLGYGVVQLDVTIVNTALSSIGDALGGGVSELQWVVSAYTIAFAAFILTAGALGDRIGAKRVFMAGFAIFTAASVACALAPDAAILIAARCGAGIGRCHSRSEFAGVAQPRLSGRKVARSRRRRVGSRRQSDADGGSVRRRRPDHAGRLALDLFRQPADRPVGPVADLALCRRDDAYPQREVDLPGQFAAIAALGCLAGAIIEAGALGWRRRFVVAGFVASAGLRGVRLREAVRRNRCCHCAVLASDVSVASLTGLFVNVAIYGLIFVFSLYFQRSTNWSPFTTGLAFVPMLGAVLPVNLMAPRLVRSVSARPHHRVGVARRRCGSLACWAAPGTSYWAIGPTDRAGGGSWPAGAAVDIDVARKRGQVALRYCRWRSQFHAADRQRARRRLVRFVDRAVQRVHGGDACFADDLGWRSARGRGGDLVWRRDSTVGAAATRSPCRRAATARPGCCGRSLSRSSG